MSTVNKQGWNIRNLMQQNAVNGIFIISGIIVIVVLFIFHSLNESYQSRKADRLLELATQKEDMAAKSSDLKDEVQKAFNNYLLFYDYKKETQRIEALIATRKVRELYESYKADIDDAYGADAARNELSQLEVLIGSFETTIAGELDQDDNGTAANGMETLPDASEEIADFTDTAFTESESMGDISVESAAETIPAIAIDKRAVLKSLAEINSQLFAVDVAAGLQADHKIKVLKEESNLVPYLLFSLLIFLLMISSWGLINLRQRRSMEIISDDLNHIARGELPEQSAVRAVEMSSIHSASDALISYLDDANKFARKIGEGDFEYDFSPKSDQDALGNSLIEMRNRLQEVAREDKIRNWTNEGQAKFGDLLREYSDNLEMLGSQLLSNLIEYLHASQGALFVVNEDGDTHLELLSAYANKRKKFITKKILPGEGLVGQVYEEGKSTFITDVRGDHYNIETGLGESRPSCILIVPLKEENKVEGVLELASLQKFQKHEIAFVEAIASSIASSFNSGKINETTKRLLEETQEKAEQMKAQEEELRQNMEELAATQEQMERRNREMEAIQDQLSEERYLLQALLKESKDHIYFKDRDSKFIRVSQSMVELFKVKDESEIIGKSDFDFGFGEHAKVAFEDEQRIIRTGKPMEDAIEAETWDDGHITYVSTTKNPLRDLNGQIVGTFGISRDVTHTKQDEIQVKKNKDWLESYFHFTPLGFVVMDQHGHVHFVSEKFRSVTKKEDKLKFDDIFTGVDFEEFLTAIAFKDKKDEVVEITMLLHDRHRTELACVAVVSGKENEDGTTNIFVIQKQ